MLKKFLFIFSIFTLVQFSFGLQKDVRLPTRAAKVNVDLIKALEQRRSTNLYADQKIPLSTLATVLWAANGINRKDGKLTAPSAMDSKFINLYVLTNEGAYLYQAKENLLKAINSDNLKDKIAIQSFVKTAPCVFILTAEINKLPVFAGSKQARLAAAYANTGFIGQNIYLAASALNLGTRYVMYINEKAVRKGLKLKKAEYPLCLMTLGFPEK